MLILPESLSDIPSFGIVLYNGSIKQLEATTYE